MLARDSELHVLLGAGHRRRSGADEHHFHVREPLAGELQCIDQRRAGDDRGAVLIVVEDRNLHLAAQPPLDDEALGALHVLEVHAAEGGLERLHHLAEGVDVPRVHLDVEHVDVRELLEEDGFALHHRLRRVRSDVSETEHGRSVGDHRHQVSAGGVLVGEIRILGDLQAGFSNARAVGKRQVPRGCHRLGRDDLDLSLPATGVVVERVLPRGASFGLERAGHGGVCLPRIVLVIGARGGDG